MQQNADALKKAKVQVIGVSYDGDDVLKSFAKQKNIKFALHSDAKSELMGKYKVRNDQVRKGSRQDGICHPVTVVVGQDGKVKARLMKSVRQRPTPQEIIDAAKKARKDG